MSGSIDCVQRLKVLLEQVEPRFDSCAMSLQIQVQVYLAVGQPLVPSLDHVHERIDAILDATLPV